MTYEPKVKKNLQIYFKKKKYVHLTNKFGKVKEPDFPSQYQRKIKFDIMVAKKGQKRDKIIFIECKGANVRSIAQGYGQLIFYKLLLKRVSKQKLEKVYRKLGLNPFRQKDIVYGMAFHKSALTKHKNKHGSLIKSIYMSYRNQGIRTYIVGKTIRIIHEV